MSCSYSNLSIRRFWGKGGRRELLFLSFPLAPWEGLILWLQLQRHCANKHDFAARGDNLLLPACVSSMLSCQVLISINALKVKRSCDFVVLHNVR